MTWWKRNNRDLDRELRSHFDLLIEEQQECGLSPGEARNAACRAFGNSTSIKEEVREMWGWTPLKIVIQDLGYAIRALKKSPGFAVTAILTLALGIGASTAVFTVVDSVVLEPLGYRDSSRLVAAWERIPTSPNPFGPNPRHADLWAKRSNACTGMTLLRQGTGGLAVGTEHPRMVGTVASYSNLFDVLQVTPFLGRGFLPEDGAAGHDNLVILTYSLWQSQFNSDPNVVGKIVRLNDNPKEIIGVLPASFHFPNGNALHAFWSKQSASSAPEPAIFVPVAPNLERFDWNGEYGNWIALARLKPGITNKQAEAQLTSLEAEILQMMPANQRGNGPGGLTAFVQPLQEAVVGDSKTGLWLLMAAVIGLMLLACVNLANAQLGRTLSRQREAAVRTALGAAKWRIVWNSLAENLLLAAAGGVAGAVFALARVNLFRHYSPVDLPRLSEIHLNVTVLLFSAALTLGSSILSGVLPALRLSHTDPQSSLQLGNRRALGGQSRKLRSWLIGLQVFGCTALLLVTGLFSKSLLHLLHEDRGFDTGNVMVAETSLPTNAYGTDQSRIAFYDRVLENLRAIPGVQSAGMVSRMPLEGESWIEGFQRVDRPNQESLINLRWASPGYFETTRQTLVAGRFFEERDRNLSSAIVSQALARALWQDENPIGSQAMTEGRKFQVIGVVGDSRSTSLKAAPVRMAYLHYKDRPQYATVFMARGPLPPEVFAGKMRQAIWKQSPDIMIARVKTLDSQLSDSLAAERFQTLVLMSFGIAALLLAMLGIYGVLSYSTAVRKQEIGLRMALGATRRKIYSLTMGEAGVPVFAGLAAGLVASTLAGHVIKGFVYDTQAVDLTVIVIVTALFLAAAVTAAFVPARRATRVDPMEALRPD